MTSGPTALLYHSMSISIRESGRAGVISGKADVIFVTAKQFISNTAKFIIPCPIVHSGRSYYNPADFRTIYNTSRNCSIDCMFEKAKTFAPPAAVRRKENPISIETLDAYKVHPIIPTEKCWIPLSHIDILMPDHDILACFVYAPPPAQAFQSIVSILKTSLSEALVAYYPLAGRLTVKEKERPSLYCNDSGVEFEEASADARFDDIDYFQPYNFDNLAPRKRVSVKGQYQEELPFSVKVTRFKCGGIVLGCRFHHKVVDACAAAQFLISWSQMSRGLKLSQQPFHHRRLAIKPRDPPQPNIAEQQYVETPRRATSENDPRMEVRSYYLSKSMIEDLKKEAQADAYSSVTAFFWRASVRARKVALAQKASISVVMNGRRILDLPPGLFGNVVFYSVAEAEVGSLLSEPLGVAAHLVAKAVAALDKECFQSIIDMVEKQRHRLLHEGSTIRPKVYLENPDLMLSSSLASFPLYKVNFGWGCPCFVSMNPSRRYPGFLYFNRAPPQWGVGLVANIECLNAHELDIDHEFGTLARNIPQLSSLASILNVDGKQVYDHSYGRAT